jgi:hypothetical protein
MCSRVHAPREAGNNCKSRVGERARQAVGKAHSSRKSIASPHHRDRGHPQNIKIAAHGKQRGRIVDHLQARRIVGLAHGEQCDARGLHARELALRLCARADMCDPNCTASAG